MVETSSILIGFIGILMIALVVMLIGWLMTSIGLCFVLRKAGYAGWQAFVPIYKTYIMSEFANAKQFFIGIFACSIASGVLSDTPTAKARWVLMYSHFQIYSKAYKTNEFPLDFHYQSFQ